MKRLLINRLTSSLCGLAMLLLGLSAVPALATTYFVAPTGNDGNSTTLAQNPATPWRTISNAVAKAVANDTISITNGTYTLSAAISLGKVLTLTGSSPGAPADTIINGNYMNGAVVTPCLNITTNVTINNLTITGGTNASYTGAGFYVSGGNPSQPTVFSNCWFTNNMAAGNGLPAGIGAQQGAAGRADYPTAFYTCLFARNVGQAISLVPYTANAYTFSNCIFTGNQITNVGSGGAALVFTGTHVPGSSIASANITGCVFSNNVTYASGGGAIQDTASNIFLTITNSSFVTNWAVGTAGAVWLGLGTISGCGFTNNYNTAVSTVAGAVYIGLASGGTSSSGTVQNCSFSNNWTTGVNTFGGAFGMQIPSVANVLNCSFVANSNAGSSGGALYLVGKAVVSNCTFIGNSSAGNGGAIYTVSSTRATDAMNIYGCDFMSNSAFSSTSFGGAIDCATTNNFLIQNSRFLGNTAYGSSTRGGGAICFYQGYLSNPPVVRNCLIAGNVATTTNLTPTGVGGGVFANGPGVLDSCTIVKNYASSAVGGGALYIANTYTVTMTNCIVYSNSCVSGSYSNFANGGTSATNISYFCCLQETNGMGSTYSTNNCQVGKYPQFANAGTGYGTNLLSNTFDFHLVKGSPCIDAGFIESSWMSTATDQTGANQVGNPRVIGNSVDIGCYEYKPGVTIGTSIFFR